MLWAMQLPSPSSLCLCSLLHLSCCFSSSASAFNDEVRTTLRDKRLQEVLLKIDGAPNREQVRAK